MKVEPFREHGRWLLPSLAALFFLSGACALVYQVVWLRLLGLVFGVTIHAASSVLAGFMAGLALGSLGAGWLADRVRRPMVWFGAAEVLIGASALATPLAIDRLLRIYVRVAPAFDDSLAALTLARLGISFLVLLVPTVLMGATLPLVVRTIQRSAAKLGERVGILYGTNTAGAIVGTLAAGLLLIPALGMSGTLALAALTNTAVGVMALGLALLLPPQSLAGPAAPDVPDVSARTARIRRTVLVVFAFSGLAALALEVIWFRVLVLFIRPTVYAFGVMLATVLAGIALGSWLAAPLLKGRANWVLVLAGLQCLIGFVALLSIAMLQAAPAVETALMPTLSLLMPPYLGPLVVTSVLVILPTMILMGLAFPIGVRLWVGEDGPPDRLARRLGLFYALNVCGAIAGSLLAGFVLLPALGSRYALALAAAIPVASGAALAACALPDAGVRRKLAGLGGLAAAFGLGVWAGPEPIDVFLAQRYPTERVLWREEGIQTTVSVHEVPGVREGLRVLYLDGNHQASNMGSMTFVHRRIGHLAMALHADPREALVIGLGGGATAGAVSLHGARTQIVELSPSVVRAGQFFTSINHLVLHRPNVAVRVDDGRNYLMLTPTRYDVVTADIILPIHAGAGNVYSAEYFQLVREALDEDGLALQWVAGTDAEHRLITRTFLSAFPETTLWADGSLLVGRKQPLRLRRADFERRLASQAVFLGLSEIGIESFDDLVGMFLAGPDELRAYVGEGPVIRDDRPLVEYFLSLPRDRPMDVSGVRGPVERYLAD